MSLNRYFVDEIILSIDINLSIYFWYINLYYNNYSIIKDNNDKDNNKDDNNNNWYNNYRINDNNKINENNEDYWIRNNNNIKIYNKKINKYENLNIYSSFVDFEFNVNRSIYKWFIYKG